jgi:CHAT domain-containing protein
MNTLSNKALLLWLLLLPHCLFPQSSATARQEQQANLRHSVSPTVSSDHRSGHISYLYQAQRAFAQRIAKVEQAAKALNTLADIRAHYEQHYPLFEQAVEHLYTLYELTDSLHHLEFAYDYARRSKGALLKLMQGETSLPEVEALQHQLALSAQGLLHYFLTEKYLFVFRLWEGHFDAIRLPRPARLEESVARLRKAVIAGSTSSKRSGYEPAAYKLYQQIFAPATAGLPRRLIIVPDGILHELPFEALLQSPVEQGTPYDRYPYLLREYQISYSPLVYGIPTNTSSQGARKRCILGIAPSYAYGENSTAQRAVGPLLSNGKELAQIGALFPLDAATGEEASLARFLSKAPDYAVLHLATHGKADRKQGLQSYLSFTEADLTAEEIQHLKIRAELVVLSACESGIGELSPSQGVISLAQGFMQAGAGSTVYTLWPISDQASAELMAYFYEGLSAGLPKDEALRAAKQHYLEQAPAERQHPFFWAAYACAGEVGPLELEGRRSWWWVLGIVIGISFWWRVYSRT